MRACHGMCGVDGSKKLTKSRLLRSVPLLTEKEREKESRALSCQFFFASRVLSAPPIAGKSALYPIRQF